MEIPDVKMSAFSLVCAAQSNRKNNLINSTAMSLAGNRDPVTHNNPQNLLWAVFMWELVSFCISAVYKRKRVSTHGREAS